MVSKFLLGDFCVKSLPNRAAVPEVSSWSTSIAWKVLEKPKILPKRPPLALCSLWREHRHWDICIPGIHSNLRSWPEQSDHIPVALLPRRLQATYIDSNVCPRFQLYRKGACFHYLWLYSQITVKDELYKCVSSTINDIVEPIIDWHAHAKMTFRSPAVVKQWQNQRNFLMKMEVKVMNNFLSVWWNNVHCRRVNAPKWRSGVKSFWSSCNNFSNILPWKCRSRTSNVWLNSKAVHLL